MKTASCALIFLLTLAISSSQATPPPNSPSTYKGLRDLIFPAGSGPAPASSESHSTGTPPDSVTATASNNQCLGLKTLPIEFFSDFTQNGSFEVKVLNDRIEFPPLRFGECFFGSGPVKIGINNERLKDGYVITATVKEGIENAEQFSAELLKCINALPSSNVTIHRILLDDIRDVVDVTKPIFWGVAGGDSLFSDISMKVYEEPLRKKDSNDPSCFQRQDISETPPILFAKEDEEAQDFIGECTSCQKDLAERLQDNPALKYTSGVLQRIIMESFINDLTAYQEIFRESNDPEALKSFDEKDFLKKLKRFLVGENGDGSSGLLEYYANLTEKIDDLPEGDGREQLESERKDIKQFLNILSAGLLDQNGLIDLYKQREEYKLAEDASLIGLFAFVAGDDNNRSLDARKMVARAKRGHRGWRDDLRKHRQERDFARIEQHAIENPYSGKSSIYDKRFRKELSEFNDVQKANRRWQRDMGWKAYSACTNTKMPKTFHLRLGPFTRRGHRRMARSCERVQRAFQDGQVEIRHDEHRRTQKLYALQDQAERLAQAEAEGFRRMRERGEFFHDGFGYSDDLHSPLMDTYSNYNQFHLAGGRYDHLPRPHMPTRHFDYDPRLGLMQGPLPQYPHRYGGGNYHYSGMDPYGHHSSYSFGSPHSYAMPPNFHNASNWGFPPGASPMMPQRYPTGYFSPPVNHNQGWTHPGWLGP